MIQKSLLKAGHASNSLRDAARIVWETKPLNLSKRSLTETDYKALANSFFPSLILQRLQLGTKEIGILALSSQFTYLDLSYNNFGAEGVKEIAATNLSHLTALDLCFNSIGKEGAKAIAAKFPLLTTLDLSYNSIGDERERRKLPPPTSPS